MNLPFYFISYSYCLAMHSGYTVFNPIKSPVLLCDTIALSLKQLLCTRNTAFSVWI